MIENEFKIMLDQGQYEKVLEMFGWNEVIVQVNHYYDTDDLILSSLHITCRVREIFGIEGKYFLQMKFPAAAEYSRVELEKPLDALPETLTADELLRPNGYGDLPNVKRLGMLKTTRNVHRFEGGEIDLDKSEYFGKTDYEIEVEFTDENSARKVLSKITEKLGIEPNSEVCAGKIRRFLEEYKNARSYG